MKTCTLFLLLLSGISLFAQNPGDLYTDFGMGGIVMENWPDTTTSISDMVTMSDHTLIFNYLTMTSSCTAVAVTKLDESGEIQIFGNTPRGFTHDFSDYESAQCMEKTPEGNVLVAGSYGSMIFLPYIMKLLPTGELDATFGDEGIFTGMDLQIRVSAMAIYPDGDTYYILVSGLDIVDHSVLFMIDAAGQLVTTFGDMGIVDLGYLNGIIRDIEVDAVHDFVFLGIILDTKGIKIMKLSLPEGAYDDEFADDGVLTFAAAEDFQGRLSSIIYKAENNTLAIFGNYPHPAGDEDIYAYRINADDGTADATFGISGLSTLRSVSSEDKINNAILQSDGKYYFGGYTDYAGTPDFLLGRLNDNGLGDPNFGVNGLFILVEPLETRVARLALSADETILFAAGNVGGIYQAVMMSAHHTGYEVPVKLSPAEPDKTIAYPNPAFEIVNLTTGYSGLHSYEMRTINGSIVKSGQFNGERFHINVSSLPPAVYFLKVSMPDKLVKIFKILKQN